MNTSCFNLTHITFCLDLLASATLLFFVVSKELYRITMSLRGMVMPDDKNITWKNSIGLAGILAVSYLAALILHTFSGTVTTLFL